MENKVKIELPLAQFHRRNNNLKLLTALACVLFIIFGGVFGIFCLKIIGGIAFILMQIFEFLLPDYTTKGTLVFLENEVWIIANSNKEILNIPKTKIFKILITSHKRIKFGAKAIHKDYGGSNAINSDLGHYNFILGDREEKNILISFLKENYPDVSLYVP